MGNEELRKRSKYSKIGALVSSVVFHLLTAVKGANWQLLQHARRVRSLKDKGPTPEQFEV
jgi:hypothetical protein